MFTLSDLYHYSLWISAPLFFISAVSLFFCIRGVIRLQREAQIASVPLVERQEIEFLNAGPVVLCLEGPLFTSRFDGLSYELSGDNGRSIIRGRSILFRNSASSFSKVRMELENYTIPVPGKYLLKVKGLAASQEQDAEHRLVFTRPLFVQTMGYVVGITLSAMLLIGSLVFFMLRLTE